VPFRAPNPEVPAALERAIAVAQTEGADLVLATDPDADRIGGAVPTPSGWRALTGNEIASLVVDHGLAHRGGSPIVVRTEVTTGLVSRLARARGARVIDHLLVGFKYIGEVLRQLEVDGHAEGRDGTTDDFLVGVEESHGVLVTPAMRDKDAAGGALWLAEAASRARDRGASLAAHLASLAREHGTFVNVLRSCIMEGATGRARMSAALDALRAHPPVELGGLEVTAFVDHLDPEGVYGPILSETDAASRNVMVVRCGDSARVVLRPSGTEPKIKLYVEVASAPGAEPSEVEPALRAQAGRLVADLLDRLLAPLGLSLPSWAHAMSDLVPVELKHRLAVEVIPEWEARLGRGEPVEAWLREALAPLGSDAGALLGPALERRAQETGLRLQPPG
jgi:phosphomannomutase